MEPHFTSYLTAYFPFKMYQIKDRSTHMQRSFDWLNVGNSPRWNAVFKKLQQR